jgi:hypothetical protein
MSTAGRDVYDLILASPYAGNWNTYGQGPEHNFFTRQARPTSEPAAPLPAAPDSYGQEVDPNRSALGDLGGDGMAGAATGPGNGSFGDIGFGPSVSGDPSINGGAPAEGPSYAGPGPSYSDIGKGIGMMNSALGMVGMPSLPGLGLGLSAIGAFADYTAAQAQAEEMGLDPQGLSYGKGLANAALPGVVGRALGFQSFADQLTDMEVSRANEQGPSLAQSLADAASYAENFGPFSGPSGMGADPGLSYAGFGGFGDEKGDAVSEQASSASAAGEDRSSWASGATSAGDHGVGPGPAGQGTGNDGSGAGGAGAKMICTELHRQGFMPSHIYGADQDFAAHLMANDPGVMVGYCLWAPLIVRLMRRSRAFTRITRAVAMPWARQMAFVMGVEPQGNALGAGIMAVGMWSCRILGRLSYSSRRAGHA